jgi:hypothetical protein
MRNGAKLFLLVILGFVASHLAWRLFFAAPEDSMQWRFREAQLLLKDGPLNFYFSEEPLRRGPQAQPNRELGFDLASLNLVWRACQVCFGDVRMDARHAQWLDYRAFWFCDPDSTDFRKAHQNRLAEAETLCQRALSMRMRLFGEQHLKTGQSILLLGEIHARRKSPEAIRDYKRAYRIMQKTIGDKDSRTQFARGCMAFEYETMGSLDKAEKVYRELWELQRLPQGGMPLTPLSKENLAAYLCRTNRAAEAAILYEDVLRQQRKLIEHGELTGQFSFENHISTIEKLVETYIQAQNFESAEALVLERLDFHRVKKGETDIGAIYWREKYADLLLKMRRIEEAERQYQRACLLRTARGASSLEAAQGLEKLADFYLQTNRPSLAEGSFRKSAQILIQHVSPNSTELVSHYSLCYSRILHQLSAIERRRDNLTEAKRLDREASRVIFCGRSIRLSN